MVDLEREDRSGMSKLALVAFALAILAILLIISFSIVFKKNWSHNGQIQDQQNDQIQQIQTATTNLEDSIEHLQFDLRANNDALNHLTQLTSGDNQWVLEEVEYLIQMAQFSLQFEGNINNALTLLQTADKRLAAESTPNFLSIRQALAESIASLQAISAPDLTFVMTRLDGLMDQVEKMPLVPQFQKPQVTVKQPKTDTKLDSYLTDWHNAMANSSHALAQLVVIRRHDQNVEPLLEPSQFTFLKQNINLQLQFAQWAALHRNQQIYTLSLRRAGGWINKYFTDNSLAARNLSNMLSELQNYSIAPQLPDLNSTMLAVQDAIKKSATQNSVKSEPISVMPAQPATSAPLAPTKLSAPTSSKPKSEQK